MANSHQPPFLNSHISQPTPHPSPFSRSSGPHPYALVLVVRVQPIVFRFGLRHHRDFHTCRFDSECSLCRLFRLGHTCIPYSVHYRYTGSTVGASQTAKSLTPNSTPATNQINSINSVMYMLRCNRVPGNSKWQYLVTYTF